MEGLQTLALKASLLTRSGFRHLESVLTDLERTVSSMERVRDAPEQLGPADSALMAETAEDVEQTLLRLETADFEMWTDDQQVLCDHLVQLGRPNDQAQRMT